LLYYILTLQVYKLFLSDHSTPPRIQHNRQPTVYRMAATSWTRRSCRSFLARSSQRVTSRPLSALPKINGDVHLCYPTTDSSQLIRFQTYATDKDIHKSSSSNDDDDDDATTLQATPPNPTTTDTIDFQIPGAQAGGKKLAIVYTCKVCETRSIKQFSEHSYQNGVVLVRCPGCKSLHLIADRLGIFEGSFEEDGKGWDIQKVMASLGENIAVVNDDNVLEMTVEDLVGRAAIEKLISNAENSTSTTEDTKGDKK
jgi:DNL zinc finger